MKKNITPFVRILPFLTLFFLLFSSVEAQIPFTVELKITATDTSNNPIVKIPLVLGIDTRATDSIDLNLGEQALPGHPPSGFHAGMLVYNELSYKDYRRIPPLKKFKIQYELNVSPKDPNRQDKPFFITWEYPLSKYIDSAQLTDRIDGSIVSFWLDSKGFSPLITTPLSTYFVNVWYNVGSVDVQEFNNELITDNIKYRPESDVIAIESVKNSKISLYSSIASLLWHGEMGDSNSEINVQNLPLGMYFLAITKPNGMTTSHKVMLIR
ncbi:MAG: hypothetical protein JST20_03200 [Bacteroidetes bacterium]|nr:hypothetical protein [Bacteroidota bacterium]